MHTQLPQRRVFHSYTYVHLLLVPLTWFIQMRHDGWAAAVDASNRSGGWWQW